MTQIPKWLKISFFACLVTVIIIAGAYVGMNRLIENTIENNFKNTAYVQEEIVEKSIHQFLEQIFNDVNMVSSFPSFRNVGNGISSYRDQETTRKMRPSVGLEEEKHLYEIMKIYGNSHPGTDYVYIGTTYGGYLCWPEVDIVPHYDPRVRPWYTEAVKANGKIVQTTPYVDLVTGKLIISNVKAVYNDKGQFNGVMGIDFAMDQMANVVKDLQENKGSFLLVHDTGMILTDTANSDNDFKYLSESYPSLSDRFKSEGSQAIKIQGDSYLMLSKKIEGTQWYLLVIKSKATLFKEAQSYIRNLSIGTVLIVVIFMLVTLGGSYMLFYNRTLQKMVRVRTQDLQDMIDELISKDIHLRTSEAKVRSLVENIPGVVYRCESQYPWRMITISNWVEKITGYAPEGFTDSDSGLTWASLIHEEDMARVNRIEAVNHGDYFELEYRIIHQNGAVKWVFERGGLNIDNDGLSYMDGVIFDITDRKFAEEEIKKLYEELENRVEERTEELKHVMGQLMEQEKMASLGGIVSGVAHEINTPLGIGVTIGSYLKKIHEEMADAFQNGHLSKTKLVEFIQNNRESYEILETNLTRAAELVNSFKKISVDQSSEDQIYFNLYEYLQMILLSLKHEYKNKDYYIQVICNPEIELYSYPGAFSQIFTNFLLNSFIHGFKNRNEGHIKISADWHPENKKLIMIYEDDGRGISPENLDHIFEPFYTTNRSEGGSGLGLYIVYNLITQKLKGNIHCSSVEGKGTKFTIIMNL